MGFMGLKRLGSGLGGGWGVVKVGHLVARHAAERMSFGVVLMLAQVLISTVIDAPELVAKMSSLLFSLPFSRM